MAIPREENEFQKFKKRSASLVFRWLGFWFAAIGCLFLAGYILLNFGSFEALRELDSNQLMRIWDYEGFLEGNMSRKEKILMVLNLTLIILRLLFSVLGQFFGVLSFVKSEDGNLKGMTSLLINDLLFLALLGEFLVGTGVWEL